MEGLNLLPWREQKKEEQKQQFIKILVATFIAGILIVISTHMFFSEKIQHQKAINNYLQTEVNGLDAQIAQIKDLKIRKDEMIKRLHLIYKLQASRPLIVNAFDTLVRIVPQGLYIRNIERKGDILTLEGSSESNTRVSEFMLNADASSCFEDAKLLQIKTDTVDSDYPRSFILNLRLTSSKNKNTKDDQ